VQRFDLEGFQTEVVEAVSQVVKNARSHQALGEERRILMLLGEPGAGKTHLIVRELSKFDEPVFAALVFGPDNHIEFKPWFDRQLVLALLKKRNGARSSLLALREKIIALTPRAMQQRIEKFSERLSEDRNFIAIQTAVNRAARHTSFGRIGKGLFYVASKERSLADLADELAQAAGIADISGSRDFCAALLLLEGPMQTHAANWLLDNSVPASLESWRQEALNAPTPRSIVTIVSTIIEKLGGCLVVCFDQLERLASGASDGSALGRLIKSAIQLLQAHSNIAVIVSALPDLYQQSLQYLDGAEKHRIGSSEPQTLAPLKPVQIPKFVAPRLEYLSRDAAHVEGVKLLDSFAGWMAQQRMLPPPPRLVLRALEMFGRKCRYDEDFNPYSTDSMSNVWAEATGGFSRTSASVVNTDSAILTISAVDEVEAEWQHFQARAPQANLLPLTTIDLVADVKWALESVAGYFHGVQEISGFTIVDAATKSLDYLVQTRSCGSLSRRMYFADKDNYAKALRDQMAAIANEKGHAQKIVIRPYRALPAGPSSQITPISEAIRRSGGLTIDLSTDEAILIAQLKRFSSGIAKEKWPVWIQTKHAMLPSIERSVMPA